MSVQADTHHNLNFKNSLEFAQMMDDKDALASFQSQFTIPQMPSSNFSDSQSHQQKNEIYFCGNSLGLMPEKSRQYVEEELIKWGYYGVKGHFESEHPWMPYHEFLARPMANIVGAEENEVVCMNSLTTNLHLMMVSFYRPTKKRFKILIEDHAFPSDTYAVASQLKFHGYSPEDAMIKIAPRTGEELIREQDIQQLIEQAGDEIALILLPGVQYYTGQVFPMEKITQWGHNKGCMVGFDLAHAAGNIEMQLHQWQVDFACWCHYKYLNSGPGAIAGCFVHEKHHRENLPRFSGWWGHDKTTRFKMGSEFHPIPSAEAWQLSNPPILSLASIRGALDTVIEAGGMFALRKKSMLLTGYLEFLLLDTLAGKIHIITPENKQQRGCQLSLTIATDTHSGKDIFQRIENAGVTADWREPNVIRIAPVPLYNSFSDVYQFVDILSKSLEA